MYGTMNLKKGFFFSMHSCNLMVVKCFLLNLYMLPCCKNYFLVVYLFGKLQFIWVKNLETTNQLRLTDSRSRDIHCVHWQHKIKKKFN